MRGQLFFLSWMLVGVMTLFYVVNGSIVDALARRNRRRREDVLAVLSVVLFEADDEAERVHAQVLRLPRGPLLAVLQSLAVDLSGQASRRLHHLVRSTGLEQFIRRRALSRHWRLRVQAAQLQHLVDHPDFDRAVLLHDRKPLVRARAAESLLPEQAADHLDELFDMLGDPSVAVRTSASHTLLRAGSIAVPALLSHLRSDDEERVRQALQVAVNLPDSRLVEVLDLHASSDDPGLRAMAARVLGNGSGVSAVDVLHRLLDDPEPMVRSMAIESLARLDSMASATRIGLCLSDESYQVRRAAGGALDDLEAAGRLVLRRHLEDTDRFGRDMARQILDAAAARDDLGMVPPAIDPLERLDENDPYLAIASSVRERLGGRPAVESVGAEP